LLAAPTVSSRLPALGVELGERQREKRGHESVEIGRLTTFGRYPHAMPIGAPGALSRPLSPRGRSGRSIGYRSTSASVAP
jgi:hypothetical protein